MNELAATWPFSSGDDFFGFMVLASVLLAGLGVLIAIFVGQRLDGPIRTVDNASASSSAASTSMLSSPVALGLHSGQLVVGRLPRGEELWLVAYLRGGRRRLEAALFVAARHARWLYVDTSGDLGVNMEVEPSDPLLQRFKLAMARTTALSSSTSSKTPVHAAGAELEPIVRDAAVEAHVLRTPLQNMALQLVAFAGVLVVIALLLVHAALVDAQLIRGIGVFGTVFMLPWVLMLYGGVAVGGATFVLLQHRQAQAYLRWLDGVVDALRADVLAGVEVREHDLVLIAALDGPSRLGATAQRLRIDLLR